MSQNAPDVSVVLGVRDAVDALDSTLESLFAQQGVAVEVVVVDDGSTDDTPARLAAWATREPRLRVLRQEATGLTAALIRGCAAASAPLVARQDAGDTSRPDRLRRQKDLLDRHAGVALVSCWCERAGPGGEPLGVERGAVEPGQSASLFAPAVDGVDVGPTAHGTAMFRRADYEAVGGYRREFALAQDWDLWLRLGERGGFALVGERLYRRVLSPRSLSFAHRDLQLALGAAAREASRRRRAGEDEAPALARAAALSEALRRRPAAPSRRAEALGAYHVGELLRRAGDARCRGYLRRAWALDPTLLRAWIRWAQSATLGDAA